ncbi:Aspartyl/glutamyl-tRNA(Asn/Gln) amidotransferase subunit B [Clostridium bornimense]|uniref:Aspartyl/glutamyl-tRNA(Asn/Gln) amidotransferase subunit B n=1 Tax=Clostridium bornimense TaxID=1216932 RepID=W6RZK2_9CLOT|nr:Asp-tRNA(Asn)/Glu-tRNA(Gln) amidotransferase subunit GatB [Clostridium bornimense]CDM67437.1 Aspartyl/glutamyl-tRNA(Asn/Gln) amidotransferase subunit B [Clostridium bornimense]
MNFETVIGLEIHAELKTKTKIFCSCSTEFGAEPNANTCPICMGLPGTLPVLNEEVVNLAIKAGKALGCDINLYNKMDRKNYFYPDLPKAYQTSQYDIPICSNGLVEFNYEGKDVKVRLNRIHIEEDAGKLVHVEGEPISLIDYNRVGVPLAEIVTEPDIRSVGEAVAFMKALKGILEYAEVSDCRMEEGSLRCDANISLRPVGQEEFGTRVELKNINSFRELQKALEKEEKRQRELYQFNEGHKVVQETRRWDSGKGKTIPMRTKEEAHDYRYFREPDLAPIIISSEQVEAIKNSLPEMPDEKRERFLKEYSLSEKEVDILIGDKGLATYFEVVVDKGATPKIAANWILGDILRILKEKKLESKDIAVLPEKLAELIKVIEAGKISTTAGKEVLDELFVTDDAVMDIIEKKGLMQISSSDELEKMVLEVIDNNPKSVEDFKTGKTQAASFLMGQVMKMSKGKANPKLAKEMIDKKLMEI